MHIAIFDEGLQQAREVHELLVHAGHRVSCYAQGRQILRGLRQESFDLFVLTCCGAGSDGFSVLQHLRERSRVDAPVMVLTGPAQQEEEAVAALNAGADDCCSQPLRRAEFLARIGALQRRCQPIGKGADSGELLPGYFFERSQRRVSYGERQVVLTEKEYELARLLFGNLDRPIARNRIMHEVWGREEDALSRTLDVHVSWLRRKLDLGPEAQRLRLVVVHGFGYRLIEPAGRA